MVQTALALLSQALSALLPLALPLLALLAALFAALLLFALFDRGRFRVAARWVGRGDKNDADGVAVEAIGGLWSSDSATSSQVTNEMSSGMLTRFRANARTQPART